MGELSQTFWSRIRGNNVAFTKDNGTPTGSVQKETNAVSGTMARSGQKPRHRQFLPSPPQDMKIQREPHVLKVEVHLGEFLVCRASIILKVLVRIHLVKSGIFQNACCTRQKRDANSVKSALSHTAGVKNSPVKGLK